MTSRKQNVLRDVQLIIIPVLKYCLTNIGIKRLSKLVRFWNLPHWRAASAQASLCKCADSPGAGHLGTKSMDVD